MVNAAHILGISMLVGAAVPMNLRFLGVWSSIPVDTLVRVLAPVAVCGLVIAVSAGFLLFSVRALEYATIEFLQIKLALITIATVSAVRIHRRYGLLVTGASRTPLVCHAIISLVCWLGALLCGRLIAFAEN